MLTINIVNDGTGTDSAANYKYTVAVNDMVIEQGRVTGHDRADNWRKLVKLVTVASDGIPLEAFVPAVEALKVAFW